MACEDMRVIVHDGNFTTAVHLPIMWMLRHCNATPREQKRRCDHTRQTAEHTPREAACRAFVMHTNLSACEYVRTYIDTRTLYMHTYDQDEQLSCLEAMKSFFNSARQLHDNCDDETRQYGFEMCYVRVALCYA